MIAHGGGEHSTYRRVFEMQRLRVCVDAEEDADFFYSIVEKSAHHHVYRVYRPEQSIYLT